MKAATDGTGRRSHGLIARYGAHSGIHDEMLGPDGLPLPLWADLIGSLDAMTPRARAERFGRSDQYLRDAGVYYRVYDKNGPSEREWPLAHVPLLISGREWDGVAAGLVERAELLEQVVADIYGPNDLVRRGLLPPALVAGNPEFLRPLASVRPRGGHFLHFLAFELGRGADGRWCVLGDRAQAPSGAGFALENRVAVTRALADLSTNLNVHRLAGFFRAFRETLLELADAGGGRAAILTPGPLNETYFEHAWIARYLGVSLLEGQDLRVADSKVTVRTVSGLKPVGVLWRRVDAAFMDPLELRGDSWIGTPGLTEALRSGTVAMVNALGSGIVETRALLAYLPAIAKALNGSAPLLPSVATWWCGDDAARGHVAAHLDGMVIGPALSTRLPFEDVEETVAAGSLDTEARAALLAKLDTNGPAFAAQEDVSLSSTPVYAHGRLEPRPVSLRAFAARTPQGWIVMPGGLARVGRRLDPAAIAMQRGGQAADVWIVSPEPVGRDTLLTGEREAPRRYNAGDLPSRAAENLFWLGRYAERLESTVRILRAYHARIAESADPGSALLKRVRAHLKLLGIDASCPVSDGLLRSVDNATNSAGQIRDRFSPDGWLALTDLSKTLHRFADKVEAGDDAARAMTVVLRKLAGFSGLVHENMYRFTGWRFLEIGRRLERSIQMARIGAELAAPGAPAGALEMLIEVGDSVLTYRRQYGVAASRHHVVQLLALDPLNPRSILFQINRLREEIDLLPEGPLRPATKGNKAVDVLAEVQAVLGNANARTVSAAQFRGVVGGLGTLSDTLSRTYFA